MITPLQWKQLGIAFAVATVGLVGGSVVGGLRTPKTVPSPSTQPVIAEKIVVATDAPIIAPTPSPQVSTKPSVTASPKPKISPKPQASVAKRPFNWGITIMPFPLRESNDLLLPEQFRLAHELGLNIVRVEYAVNNEAMNYLAVEQAKKYGLKLVFIIPWGPNDIFTDSDLYNNAYRYVAGIVAKHKGDVAVYQLANEVASVALKEGVHGADRVDYDNHKYTATTTWLKAAAKAVKDTDPGAKRLVNDHWIHNGYFETFLKEGGDFDILGWNWFSEMGNDMDRVVIDKKTGQIYKLLTKLKAHKKEIWLTEVNRRLGSNDGNEKAQADFIQTMAEYAYKQPSITGFFVFNMIEDQTAPPKERGYGIVKVNPETKWVSGFKEAFGRYQALIKAKK